ncbi:hypothetical protein ACFLSQ_01590 [Bacteroidota bacterium]
MEILIAILWYLQLLIPGQSYTLSEIDVIAEQNLPAIEVVQSNPDKTQDALIYYDQSLDNGEIGLIEEWEENPIKPIHD